jgi:hypothetical protein
MKHLTSLLSVLASVLALFLASCANKSVTLGPDGKPVDSQGKPTNPFPPGTYDHFKAEPDYPKTMKVWKNEELLSKTNDSNSRIIISLPTQRGFLMNGDEVVIDYPVSSGVPSRPTPPGNYKILEKIVDKSSNSYGRVYDAAGEQVRNPEGRAGRRQVRRRADELLDAPDLGWRRPPHRPASPLPPRGLPRLHPWPECRDADRLWQGENRFPGGGRGVR